MSVQQLCYLHSTAESNRSRNVQKPEIVCFNVARWTFLEPPASRAHTCADCCNSCDQIGMVPGTTHTHASTKRVLMFAFRKQRFSWLCNMISWMVFFSVLPWYNFGPKSDLKKHRSRASSNTVWVRNFKGLPEVLLQSFLKLVWLYEHAFTEWR